MKLLKNIVKEIFLTKEEKLKKSKDLICEVEQIAFNEFGISILNEDEKKSNRKELYEEIINKIGPSINSKELLDKVKFTKNMLDADIL